VSDFFNVVIPAEAGSRCFPKSDPPNGGADWVPASAGTTETAAFKKNLTLRYVSS
jgi:hypothetical protein